MSDATTRARGCAVDSTLAIAPTPGAQLHRCTLLGQQRHGAARQRFTLGPREVDAVIDPHCNVAEQHVPDDPRQWLTREATFDGNVQEPDVSGGMREKVVRLLLRCDEPGVRETRDERGTVGRERHAAIGARRAVRDLTRAAAGRKIWSLALADGRLQGGQG